MGVDAIYLQNALDASYPSGVVNNFYQLNLAMGSKEDFDIMVDAFAQREIAVVVRMCVDSSTLECGMFKDEQQRQECYPISDVRRKWSDASGDSLWHSFGDEFYLSHREKRFPLLDWHSPVLRSKIAKAVRHWMSQGVKGFVFAGIDGCMYDRQEQRDFRQMDELNMKVVRFLKDVVAERGDCCSLGEFEFSFEDEKFLKYSEKGLDLLLRELPSGLDFEKLDEIFPKWQGRFLSFLQQEGAQNKNFRLCKLAEIILSADNLLLQDGTSPQDLQSYRDDNFFSVLLGYKKQAVLGVEKILKGESLRSFLLKCVDGAYLVGINFGEKQVEWDGVNSDEVEILQAADKALCGGKKQGQTVVLEPFSLAICKLQW